MAFQRFSWTRTAEHPEVVGGAFSLRMYPFCCRWLPSSDPARRSWRLDSCCAAVCFSCCRRPARRVNCRNRTGPVGFWPRLSLNRPSPILHCKCIGWRYHRAQSFSALSLRRCLWLVQESNRLGSRKRKCNYPISFANLPVTLFSDWAIHNLSITIACCVVLSGYSLSIKFKSESGISKHLAKGIQSRPRRLQMSDKRKSAYFINCYMHVVL